MTSTLTGGYIYESAHMGWCVVFTDDAGCWDGLGEYVHDCEDRAACEALAEDTAAREGVVITLTVHTYRPEETMAFGKAGGEDRSMTELAALEAAREELAAAIGRAQDASEALACAHSEWFAVPARTRGVALAIDHLRGVHDRVVARMAVLERRDEGDTEITPDPRRYASGSSRDETDLDSETLADRPRADY